MRRRITVIAFLLVSLPLGACGEGTSDTDTTDAASEATVVMEGIAFEPTGLTVEVGTTVTWTNDDSVAHTVTALDGSFLSGTLDPGDTFSHTFESTGTFDYRCEIHPEIMTGTVEVVEG